MLSNYHYFLTLAEELNIARAAEKLFISHQCLSKYLKKLEKECGTVLFQRKPRFALTYAGERMLESLRQIEMIEQNLTDQFTDIQSGSTGEVRIGIPEGRLRILMPELIEQFKQTYPSVDLRVASAGPSALVEMLENNKVDLVATTDPHIPLSSIRRKVLLKERLYLVISDNMLREYFPSEYPGCIDRFRSGANLSDFRHVPFVLNHPGFTSRDMLDAYLRNTGTALRCTNEIQAMDLHHLMTARDFAASFALTMYLPGIEQLSDTATSYSELYVFPIQGFGETNDFVLLSPKDRIFPQYTLHAISLLQKLCRQYQQYDL